MPEPFTIQSVDQLLTLEEAASWLRIAKRELSARSKGHNPAIPGIWLNERVVRFHPRAVLAKFAESGGIKPPLIAAMFNTEAKHLHD